MEALHGVVALVDVRLKDAEASESFRAILASMGAQVRSTLAKDVTHLVWQNGKKANLEKARERGSVCIVTSLWLDKCSQLGQRVEEKEYLVSPTATPDGSSGKKRYNNLEPKPLPPSNLGQHEPTTAESDAVVAAPVDHKAPSSPINLKGTPGHLALDSDSVVEASSKRLVFNSDMSDDLPASDITSSPSTSQTIRRGSNSKFALGGRKPRPAGSSPAVSSPKLGTTAAPVTPTASAKSAATAALTVPRPLLLGDEFEFGYSAPRNESLDFMLDSDDLALKRKHKSSQDVPPQQPQSQPSQGPVQSSPDWLRDGPTTASGAKSVVSPITTYKRSRPSNTGGGGEGKPPIVPSQKSPKKRVIVPDPEEDEADDDFKADGKGKGEEKAAAEATTAGKASANVDAAKTDAAVPEPTPTKSAKKQKAADVEAATSTPKAATTPATKSSDQQKKRKTPEPAPLQESAAANSLTPEVKKAKVVLDRTANSSSSASNASGNDKKKKVVVLTSMTKELRDICVSTLRHFGPTVISEKVDDATTHVICGEARRTLAVMQGILAGAWIVSSEWLLSSLSKEALLPEEGFELVETFSGATKSRTATEPLFKAGFNCFFVGETSNNDTVASLIKAAGAVVTEDPKKATLCIGNPFIVRGNRKTAVSIELQVSENWLYDCITAYSQVDLAKYRTTPSGAKSPSY